MAEKKISTLIIASDQQIRKQLEECLAEEKFRIIWATNANEARLKFANEKFSVVLFESEFQEINARDFVESMRHKEKLKNIKQLTPVFVMGKNPEKFTADFSDIDHVNYIALPLDLKELKKKIMTITGSSDAINSNTVTIKKDDYLIEEGGTSHEMYWILGGKFIVTKINNEDQKIVIGEISPGELVGEMSFLDNLPRSASVRALEDSEVLVIPHKKFIDVLEGQPRWFRSLMQTLSQRLRNANKIITSEKVTVDSHTKDVI